MKPNILLLDSIAQEGVDRLARFADLTDGRGYSRAQICAALRNTDALVVKSGNRIDRELIEFAPKLKVIGRAGSGLDNIDMDAARERGVTVVTSPEGNAESVAEHVLGVTIFLEHQLHLATRGALAGDFRRANWQGRNLAALNVGVVGVGHIGRAVIRKFLPLCRSVYAFDPHLVGRGELEVGGVIVVDRFEDLLPYCDVLTLHLPLLPDTQQLLNGPVFSAMRNGVTLVNTARGAIIDEVALRNALATGKVGAAALDVLHPDPPFNCSIEENAYAHPLIAHPRVLYTPHIAAGTRDALREVALALVDKLERFLADMN